MMGQSLSCDERADLKNDGNFIGGLLILNIVALNFLFSLLVVTLAAIGVIPAGAAATEQLGLSNTAYLLLYGVVYTVCMFCPVVLGLTLFRKPIPSLIRFGSVSGKATAFYVAIGLAGCVAANIVASYVTVFLENFGIHSPKSPVLLEHTVISLILNLIVVALLPALLEELIYRVCILGTLRRYGDGFAIVVSAVLFAFVHGGLGQSVFALLVGLVLGYLTVVTGSILPAFLVHFANNALSIFMQYQSFIIPEEMRSAFYGATLYTVGIIGGVVLFIGFVRRIRWLKKVNASVYAFSECVGGLMKAPLSTVAVVLLLMHVIYRNLV